MQAMLQSDQSNDWLMCVARVLKVKSIDYWHLLKAKYGSKE